MAQWLFVKKVKDAKREDIKIYSCGVYAENGDGPTEEAINVMKDFDVNITEHRAIKIKNSSIRDMDLILCATNGQKISVINMYPEVEDRVYTLKEYVGYNKEFHKKIDIEDPWGYNEDVYRFCANEINDCLDMLLKKI
jgi:protein-tyrosine-phosphatase